MKRLYLFLIVKYVCAVLFFAVAGVSCGKEDGPDKQDDGIRIENLDTRLRADQIGRASCRERV